MPFIMEYQPAKLFMEHNGVSIFHVYNDNDIGQGQRTYWFATHEDGDDGDAHGRNGVFDVRYLPEPDSGPSLADRPAFIGADHGQELGYASYDEWKASAEYERRRQLWNMWHVSGEAEAIRHTICHAIDAGCLTSDGVLTPDD